ncbi:acyl-CoA reductase [Maribellus comscasis]|uniref:Acyl-CoA reductase n=1 Tax=Maribellus comscasis TaxID=2681766 RepID=A0A6I6JNQ7_9BACT|nr:acyl-CoA reductase [Maribellus comscasis]QGY42749.1 acyl-CoA reductase [Maribellus comscasis]
MDYNFNKISFNTGNAETLSKVLQNRPFPPFSDDVIDFLDALHHQINKDARKNLYPDLAALGFWCRKSNLLLMKEQYQDLERRLGLGVVFHIAPSNVALNFAWSLASGLLAGCINIVRLPSKPFEQVEILCKIINSLLSQNYKSVSDLIFLIKYLKEDSDTTKFLSSISDARIIWGGDNTIAEVRKFQIGVRGIDIGFSDRYSFCVINSVKYLQEKDKMYIAQSFYNDGYTSDQLACSSPSLIVWTGENKAQARKVFWEKLQNIVKEKYHLAPSQSVKKLETFYLMASSFEIKKVYNDDNSIYRIELEKPDSEILDLRCGNGFFIEYEANQISEILPFCTKKCQTITYFGFEKEFLLKLIHSNRVPGVDRIVKIGRAMDFSLVWDGIDLIQHLSRKII